MVCLTLYFHFPFTSVLHSSDGTLNQEGIHSYFSSVLNSSDSLNQASSISLIVTGENAAQTKD